MASGRVYILYMGERRGERDAEAGPPRAAKNSF